MAEMRIMLHEYKYEKNHEKYLFCEVISLAEDAFLVSVETSEFMYLGCYGCVLSLGSTALAFHCCFPGSIPIVGILDS